MVNQERNLKKPSSQFSDVPLKVKRLMEISQLCSALQTFRLNLDRDIQTFTRSLWVISTQLSQQRLTQSPSVSSYLLGISALKKSQAIELEFPHEGALPFDNCALVKQSGLRACLRERSDYLIKQTFITEEGLLFAQKSSSVILRLDFRHLI